MNARDPRPLCVKLAGAVRREDFARFDDVYADADARHWIDQSPAVVSALSSLLGERGALTGEQAKEAAGRSLGPGFDVVQIWPEGYGYRVKVSAAPTGMEPVESTMTAAQAQQALPPEALQMADQQGTATLTGVEAEPDPLIEAPLPIASFGIYKVYEDGTGKQYLGYVVPGLFDPAMGGPTSTQIFINGNVHSMQEQPFMGTLVGLNTNLPESDVIRGLGVFYRANDKAVMMTVPYEVLGEVTLTGSTSYAARDQMGQEVQIVFSPGLKRPVLAPPNTVALPEDCKFLALDNPIQLSAPMADVMVQAKAASSDTHLRIEAWDTTCRLSGAAVEKLGSGTHSWRDGVFWMAACGVKQAQALGLLEESARAGRPIDLYRLRKLSSSADVAKEAEHRARADALVRQAMPKQASLLMEAVVLERAFQSGDAALALGLSKTAAAAVGAQTVDAVLSLNFITPENIDTFVDGLPQLEEASSKLAQLSFATSLGLGGVDASAVDRAMDCLETVIEGLKSLRSIEV